MKSATGYIFFDEKRKRWIARFAPVDKDTGKQKEFKRYCLTKTDARKKLQELTADNRSMYGIAAMIKPSPCVRLGDRGKCFFECFF